MIEISHQQARRLLRANIDAQLPNEQWMMLQAHLETCEACRSYAERLVWLEKDLKRAMRGWDSTPGPLGDITGYVLSYRQTRTQVRKWLLVAGTASLLLVMFVLLGGVPGIQARLAAAQTERIPTTGIGAATETAQAGPTALALQATPLPTAEAGQFPDVVAYQGRRDGQPNGDAEIYVLNPGSAPVDLTNNPAQDTDPSWSPDGEWLAFLSDRSGKVEVFVTNISGSRVIQLTNEPGVTWEGPLSWSPDGKMIVLSGTRDQQGAQRWIYLVELDGSGARVLAGSRGGETPKFSPSGDRLAYAFADGGREGLAVVRLQTGEQINTSWADNPLVPPPAPGSAFDWSADGSGLAYLTPDLNPLADTPADAPQPSGEPGSMVAAVRDLNYSLSLFYDFSHNLQIDRSRWPGAFRGVTWSLTGGVVYLEDLDDARANRDPSNQPQGCWTVQLSSAGFRGQGGQGGQFGGGANDGGANNGGGNFTRATSFGGLCVEGGLASSSWTPDGSWIVVQGRLPSETHFSLFALRMPYRQGRRDGTSRSFRLQATPAPANGASQPGEAAPGTVLRLTNDRWVGPLPSPRPRLNNDAASIQIDPQPVTKLPASQAQKASPPPSDLSQRPGGPPGQIVYTVENNTMSVVASSNPDGTAGIVLLATPQINRCPSLSPDNHWVALLQLKDHSGLGSPAPTVTSGGVGQNSMQADQSDGEAILAVDSSGGNLHELSSPYTIPGYDLLSGGSPGSTVTYGCPSWSPADAPGGPFVAALMHTAQKAYLAVLPVGGPLSQDAQPRYFAIDTPDWNMRPVWSADGRTIYVLGSQITVENPWLLAVHLPDDPKAALTGDTLPMPDNVRSPTIPTLAVQPDGQALAELEAIGPLSAAHLHRILVAPGAPDPVGPAVYLSRQVGSQGQDQLVSQAPSGSLTWLYGSTFGVVLHGGIQDAIKTHFYLYDLANDSVVPLAGVTDRVDEVAWSQDGHWLVYSAESGLWGLDVTGALQGRAAPVWLSPQPVQDLNWR